MPVFGSVSESISNFNQGFVELLTAGELGAGVRLKSSIASVSVVAWLDIGVLGLHLRSAILGGEKDSCWSDSWRACDGSYGEDCVDEGISVWGSGALAEG